MGPEALFAALLFLVVAAAGAGGKPQLLQSRLVRPAEPPGLGLLLRRRSPTGQNPPGPVSEALKPLKAETAPPTWATGHKAPVGPPHAPDPPHHLGEAVGGVVADAVKSAWYAPGPTYKFAGATCAEACLPCIAEQVRHGVCTCAVSCNRGTQGICREAMHGWSLMKPTIPRGDWEASCFGGARMDCSQCVNEEQRAQIVACSGNELCLKELSSHLADIHTTPKFCTSKETKGCVEFLAPPTDGKQWECFDSQEECSAKPLAESGDYESRLPSLQTPCVWCTIKTPKENL